MFLDIYKSLWEIFCSLMRKKQNKWMMDCFLNALYTMRDKFEDKTKKGLSKSLEWLQRVSALRKDIPSVSANITYVHKI